MNETEKLKWVFALAAVFALAGCGQANARNRKSDQPSPTVAALGERSAEPSADAERDNGPGCAESAVVGVARQQDKKVLAGK
jgi:hypothetical protein